MSSDDEDAALSDNNDYFLLIPPPPRLPTCIHTTNQHHARIPRARRSTAHEAAYPLQMPGWCLGRISEKNSNPKRKVFKQVVNFIVFFPDDSSLDLTVSS